jgi:hypothetical protein
LTNRQRTGVEKKMTVFVIDAPAVLYAVEEMGEERLTEPAITTRMSIRHPEEANESEATRDMPGSRSNVRETAL